jgi:hypothetical protein
MSTKVLANMQSVHVSLSAWRPTKVFFNTLGSLCDTRSEGDLRGVHKKRTGVYPGPRA